MEAIVLAGGFGTRLRKLVCDVPKPMAQISGRPFLEILLRSLAKKGFSRVILSLGFMAEKISSYFGSQFCGVQLTYVVEDRPLGTGGGIRLAVEQISSDFVFVLNGDTFIEFDATEIVSQWSELRRPVVVVCEVPDAARYGHVLIEGKTAVGFSEKGISNPGFINAGCYVLNRGQLDGFELGRAFSFESDYLLGAVRERQFDVFFSNGKFIDIGVPEDFLRAQFELAAE